MVAESIDFDVSLEDFGEVKSGVVYSVGMYRCFLSGLHIMVGSPS